MDNNSSLTQVLYYLETQSHVFFINKICVRYEHIIVYYVPRQSSKSLYKNAECNVLALGSDGKTASEYKQFDCLGRYDSLSGIGKRKRKFVCRGAEVQLRLIVLHTCTCEQILHLYRNKFDIAGRGSRGRKSQWKD